jgi:hypothetical protein
VSDSSSPTVPGSLVSHPSSLNYSKSSAVPDVSTGAPFFSDTDWSSHPALFEIVPPLSATIVPIGGTGPGPPSTACA